MSAPDAPAAHGPELAFARYSPGELAVRTRGVGLRFGAVPALAGLDLAVPRGAAYLLAGASGAGKTTALRTLLHLLRAEGEVELFGDAVAAHGAALRARVGYAAQETAPADRRLSVARVLAYRGAFHPRWDAAYAARLLERFAVPAARRLGELSPGQQTVVRLVASIAYRPALLLWDEPTAGLDPIARAQLAETLVEHLAAGAADGQETTLVISTHLIHEVAPLVDHVGVLRAGRLVAQLPVDDLHAALRRYRFRLPEPLAESPAEPWRPQVDAPAFPRELPVVSRRETARQADWVVWGDEREVVARLEQAGATHVHAAALTIEDAVLSLLAAPAPVAA